MNSLVTSLSLLRLTEPSFDSMKLERELARVLDQFSPLQVSLLRRALVIEP